MLLFAGRFRRVSRDFSCIWQMPSALASLLDECQRNGAGKRRVWNMMAQMREEEKEAFDEELLGHIRRCLVVGRRVKAVERILQTVTGFCSSHPDLSIEIIRVSCCNEMENSIFPQFLRCFPPLPPRPLPPVGGSHRLDHSAAYPPRQILFNRGLVDLNSIVCVIFPVRAVSAPISGREGERSAISLLPTHCAAAARHER